MFSITTVLMFCSFVSNFARKRRWNPCPFWQVRCNSPFKNCCQITDKRDRPMIISRLTLGLWNLAARYPRITECSHNRLRNFSSVITTMVGWCISKLPAWYQQVITDTYLPAWDDQLFDQRPFCWRNLQLRC